MESARDKAVRLLFRLFELADTQQLDRSDIERCVDAMVDLARSSESEHTRALDVRGTTGGKATTETS